MSQSSVGPILQDSKGFMWFGTSSGANKFDGYEFQIYKHDHLDSMSLSDGWITAMCETQNAGSETIWIGTINGVLNRYDRKTELFTKYTLPFISSVEEIPAIDLSNT
ncbi:MAG: two-component regulator propeller domain-containing protein, partial [bacterium]